MPDLDEGSAQISHYLLCDIEATGNRQEDRIIQLGLMLFENSLEDPPSEIYNAYNDTTVEMMPEAMEVHHITPEMLQGKKVLKETDGYKRLCELNHTSSVLIAHDVSSDLGMLHKEGFENCMQVIDTLRCAKHLLGHLDAYRLQFLRYKLGLYREEVDEAKKLQIDLRAHDALGDVLTMKRLLIRLMKETKNQFVLQSDEAAVQKLIELSATPVLLTLFPFGKYKGERIEDTAYSDPGYINWMRETLKLDKDMEFTLDYYLQ